MSQIKDPEAFEASLRIARKVLPFLGENGIPAGPENYLIFYLYFEGNNHYLKELVNTCLKSGDGWSEEYTEEVFDKIFGTRASLALYRGSEKLAEQVRNSAKGMLDQATITTEQAEKTSQSLNHSLEEVGSLSRVEDIGRWLKDVLSDVERMGEVSDNLGKVLKAKENELSGVLDSLSDIESMALTDALTKLANRRSWDSRLAQEFQRFQRYGRPCSMLILDMDDFKNINDTYGHLIGDKALAAVAAIIRCVLRSADFGARYGGEEFTCIFPETDLGQAKLAAERLRQKLEKTEFIVKGKPIQLTASFGVSGFHADDKNQRLALDRADKALYLAKRSGKNTIRSEIDVENA